MRTESREKAGTCKLPLHLHSLLPLTPGGSSSLRSHTSSPYGLPHCFDVPNRCYFFYFWACPFPNESRLQVTSAEGRYTWRGWECRYPLPLTPPQEGLYTDRVKTWTMTVTLISCMSPMWGVLYGALPWAMMAPPPPVLSRGHHCSHFRNAGAENKSDVSNWPKGGAARISLLAGHRNLLWPTSRKKTVLTGCQLLSAFRETENETRTRQVPASGIT